MNLLTATHEVTNQVLPLTGHDRYGGNKALQEGVAREGAGWADSWLRERGADLGGGQVQEWAILANREPPVLETFASTGTRRDIVRYHPAYHELMAYLRCHGVSGRPWADPKPGAHVARAALFQLFAEVEGGALCPTTMTYACVPALSRAPALAAEWLPKVLSPDYDPRFVPGLQKTGVTLGMGMTEKQGGSDVRSNTTWAEQSGADDLGEVYTLTGHKWFLSAPMSDAFLLLAQAKDGMSCFFVPRFLPDGTVNALRFQRLKEKLGDRSNASLEVELWNAHGWLVGEAGKGISVMLEMGSWTRLDCVLGSAGLMRGAAALALHHACHRRAFGKRLVQQPLMMNVLADLALETEAAQSLALRLAGAFDRRNLEQEALLLRLLTPAAKFWVCKRGPVVAAEAMEVLGGNGYVEENLAAGIYRQAPVNSIWEGSGNVMCLDVHRALRKHPNTAQALLAELEPTLGRHDAFDRHVSRLKDTLRCSQYDDVSGRRLSQAIVLAMQCALLLRHAPDEVGKTFCDSRIGIEATGAAITLGTLRSVHPLGDLIRRAWPHET